MSNKSGEEIQNLPLVPPYKGGTSIPRREYMKGIRGRVA